MNALSDPRQYVSHWFNISRLSARDAAKRPSLFGTLFLDYLSTYRVYRGECKRNDVKPVLMLKEKELQYALSEFVELQLLTELRTATHGLEFNGAPLEALKTWVQAVTGSTDDKVVSVIAHWCWMVKRKAIGKPTKHQVMPIIYGPQGGGKTQSLVKLIEPLSKFRLNLQMTSLGDERVYEGFSSNLIVLFDELQNIERTDMNVLKNQITTEFNSYRKLHTHAVINAPMNCSFIGASNRPINETLSDSTGMRRFYQINAVPVLDWAAVNSIDYNFLWQGIDETLADGYLEGAALQAVQMQQQALVNPDELSTFLDSEGLVPPTPADGVSFEATKLYQYYQDWCGRNGIRALSSIWFNRKLINNGLPSHTERDAAGTRKRFYSLNKNAKLVNEGSGALSNLRTLVGVK